MKLLRCKLSAAALLAIGNIAVAGVIPSPITDLAQQANGGVAFSSSTAFGGTPDRVNDGNRDGNYGDSSVAHSNGGADAFMGVNLPVPELLGSVVIFNRTDCCNTRIDGNGNVPFEVQLFNGATQVFDGLFTFNADINLTDADGHAAAGMTIPVGSVLANQVLLTQHNNDYMNIAEIEAYAPVPEPASLCLFGLGLAGLVLAASRRRR